MENISDKVIHIIKQVKPALNDTDINVEDSLSSLGFDSVENVELILAIEDEFQIEFDDSTLSPSSLGSVKDLINLFELNNSEAKK